MGLHLPGKVGLRVLCACLTVFKFLLLIGTPAISEEGSPVSSFYLDLRRAYFQIKSRGEVLGVRLNFGEDPV